jgi:hypothetical protein
LFASLLSQEVIVFYYYDSLFSNQPPPPTKLSLQEGNRKERTFHKRNPIFFHPHKNSRLLPWLQLRFVRILKDDQSWHEKTSGSVDPPSTAERIKDFTQKMITRANLEAPHTHAHPRRGSKEHKMECELP